MLNKKIILFSITCLLSSYLSAHARPHFYLQLDNRSQKIAGIGFEPVVGNTYLSPTVSPNETLPAQQKGQKYEVHIEPLDPRASFDIIFTGTQACRFNVSYYAPGNPKVLVSGAGCYGGGYEVVDKGSTLLLFISDIRK